MGHVDGAPLPTAFWTSPQAPELVGVARIKEFRFGPQGWLPWVLGPKKTFIRCGRAKTSVVDPKIQVGRTRPKLEISSEHALHQLNRSPELFQGSPNSLNKSPKYLRIYISTSISKSGPFKGAPNSKPLRGEGDRPGCSFLWTGAGLMRPGCIPGP